MSDEQESPPVAQPSFSVSRRDLLVGGACLAVAGGAYARMPRRRLASIPKDHLAALAPDHIADWRYETSSGIVLPPPDELARLLYDQQVTRAYVSDKHPSVMLVMAYGSSQGGMLQVHRPEICYPASGFRLSSTLTESLPTGDGHAIPVRAFTATADTRVEQVMYWTRVGNALPTSWTSQRVAIMESNLLGAVPDGLLVRLSTIGEDVADGRAVLADFARAMLVAVGPAGRRQLLGTNLA
jgi:EpsI family protein